MATPKDADKGHSSESRGVDRSESTRGAKEQSERRSNRDSNDNSSNESRKERELQRQKEWREKNKGTVSNEWRRGADGSFEKVRTDYGRDTKDSNRSKEGWISRGSVVANGLTKKFQGLESDTDFGRNLGRYGRSMTAKEAEAYMATSQINREADDALQAGRYGQYLSKKIDYAANAIPNRLQREIADFQNAPLDYVSGLLENPMISAAALASGVGLTAFGIQAVDAAVDLFQQEADPIEAASNLGVSALSYTPLGMAIPKPIRSVAKAGLQKGASEAARTVGGVAGGRVGGVLGSSLATLTDNPYASAAIATASIAGGAFAGKKGVELAQQQQATVKAPKAPRVPQREGKGDRVTSPLIASGERAIASQEALQQPAQVDLYAQTVKQLPYYGPSILQPSYQLPQYGA